MSAVQFRPQPPLSANTIRCFGQVSRMRCKTELRVGLVFDSLYRSGWSRKAIILLSQVTQDITSGQLRIVELGAQVEPEFNAIMAACYRHTTPLPIRTLDALHLASARADNQIELVATDKRMRDAARLLGLSLFPV